MIKISIQISIFVVILLLSGCGSYLSPPNIFYESRLSIDHLKIGSRQSGYASWYGQPFHGRTTASGEVYDMHQMTGAHRELPFGTFVRVVNRLNNKGVIVRINDRGPFVENRVIDLSFQSAKAIGMIPDGVIPVYVEVVQYPDEN